MVFFPTEIGHRAHRRDQDQNSGSSQTGSSGGNASGDVALLAKVISAEARGEPYDGQVAVGAVILNRIAHPSFPNTLAGVVYEPGAFTCMVDGQIDQPIASSAYQAARDGPERRRPIWRRDLLF